MLLQHHVKNNALRRLGESQDEDADDTSDDEESDKQIVETSIEGDNSNAKTVDNNVVAQLRKDNRKLAKMVHYMKRRLRNRKRRVRTKDKPSAKN